MNSTRLQVHQIFGFRNFQKFSFEKFDGVPRGECCLYRCMHFRELFLQWHFSRIRNDDEYPQRRWIIWKLLTRFKKNIIINNFYLILFGPPQFHTPSPLSSTHQFHTKGLILFRLPNSSVTHQKLSVELRGFWCWTGGLLRLKRRGPLAWNWCVELRGSVWNCDLIILNRSKAKPRLIQRKSFTRFCFWLRTPKKFT